MGTMTDDHVGEMVVTWWNDPESQQRVIRIDRADAWIRITEELVAELTEQGWAGEGLFRVEAKNGSVTYALRIQNKQNETWVAERVTAWPERRET